MFPSMGAAAAVGESIAVRGLSTLTVGPTARSDVGRSFAAAVVDVVVGGAIVAVIIKIIIICIIIIIAVIIVAVTCIVRMKVIIATVEAMIILLSFFPLVIRSVLSITHGGKDLRSIETTSEFSVDVMIVIHDVSVLGVVGSVAAMEGVAPSCLIPMEVGRSTATTMGATTIIARRGSTCTCIATPAIYRHSCYGGRLLLVADRCLAIRRMRWSNSNSTLVPCLAPRNLLRWTMGDDLVGLHWLVFRQSTLLGLAISIRPLNCCTDLLLSTRLACIGADGTAHFSVEPIGTGLPSAAVIHLPPTH